MRGREFRESTKARALAEGVAEVQAMPRSRHSGILPVVVRLLEVENPGTKDVVEDGFEEEDHNAILCTCISKVMAFYAWLMLSGPILPFKEGKYRYSAHQTVALLFNLWSPIVSFTDLDPRESSQVLPAPWE